MLLYQIIAFTIHGKIKKSQTKIINLKYQIQNGMSLNHLVDHILCQIFKINLNTSIHREKTDNPSVGIYVNKIENRITFKIKTGYYLEVLTPELIKLLGSTKSKINKDKHGENVPD